MKWLQISKFWTIKHLKFRIQRNEKAIHFITIEKFYVFVVLKQQFSLKISNAKNIVYKLHPKRNKTLIFNIFKKICYKIKLQRIKYIFGVTQIFFLVNWTNQIICFLFESLFGNTYAKYFLKKNLLIGISSLANRQKNIQ